MQCSGRLSSIGPHGRHTENDHANDDNVGSCGAGHCRCHALRDLLRLPLTAGSGSYAGLLVSSVLSVLTYLNQHRILGAFTRSPEVHAAAVAVMPIVLATQLFKALEHSTSGIIMGGQDWKWSSFGALCPLLVWCLTHRDRLAVALHTVPDII